MHTLGVACVSTGASPISDGAATPRKRAAAGAAGGGMVDGEGPEDVEGDFFCTKYLTKSSLFNLQVRCQGCPGW
jgi:hypothetical protein